MKKNKKPAVIIGVVLGVLMLCLIVGGIFALTANSAERKLSDQLELGRRYLEELDYEQAIAAFEAAIAIDPKCQEAYLSLADIYVVQGNAEKAIEILEEGYAQTDSEAVLAKLEEIRDRAEEEKEASTAENTQENGSQDADSSQTSGSEQSSGSSEAESQGQAGVDENDPFVQFLNAPFTDENGFGDVTDLDAAIAYAEKCGFVAGNYDFVPMGDLYIYYEDSTYFDPDIEKEVPECFLRVDTMNDIFDDGGSNTIYSYGNGVENPVCSINTTLGNSDTMTGGSVPPVGGFAGFLAEHDCLTVESILETIGLDSEELMTYVRADNAGYQTQVETPYGMANVEIFNYAAFEIEDVNRQVAIDLPEGCGAPWRHVYLGEGVVNSLVYNKWTHYLTVSVDSGSETE